MRPTLGTNRGRKARQALLAARARDAAAKGPVQSPAAAGVDRWRRRSSRVRQARRWVPAAMAATLVLVLGWLGARAVLQAIRPTTTGQQIRMSRPKFRGRDDQGKPYVISADAAVRDARTPDVIHMTSPFMEIVAGKPQPATLRGDVGAFNEATRILTLNGNVVFTDGSGYVFHSGRARIDTATEEVQGDAAVSGEGPLGHTTAMSYAIHDHGRRIVLTGDVHTHLINAPRSSTP